MQAVRRIAPSVVKYTSRMYNPSRFFGSNWFERELNGSWIHIQPAKGEEVEVECKENETMLEIAQNNDVEVKSDGNDKWMIV